MREVKFFVISLRGFFLLLCSWACSASIVKSQSNTKVTSSAMTPISFLQAEAAAVAEAQHNILTLLRQLRIPVESSSKSSQNDGIEGNVRGGSKRLKLRVAVSTEENNLECRVALGKAPIGSKCIAPCGCTGSAQWIQFCELNRLRRKDPSQWKFCQTCQQPFEYSALTTHGGFKGGIISTMLDNQMLLRGSILGSSILLGIFSPLKEISLRFLVSGLFWKQVSDEVPLYCLNVHLSLYRRKS